MSPLTILFTNIDMAYRSGTQVQTRNYALEMLRRSHRPIVYSPSIGAISEELKQKGIPCFEHVEDIVSNIDIIHGQHFQTTFEAIKYFPTKPAVYMCHDATVWFDEPPPLPCIRRYIAVDDAVYQRLTRDSQIEKRLVTTVYNRADIERFKPGAQLPGKPRRALVFAKNRQHVLCITQACKLRGIEATIVGNAFGKPIHSPETVMMDFDLVFASALTAMEAMATGRAVVVCDGRGLAGYCNSQKYSQWRNKNFGFLTLTQKLTVENFLNEIDNYDATEAIIVQQKMIAEGGVQAQCAELEQIYHDVIEEHSRVPLDPILASKAIAETERDWHPRTGKGYKTAHERQTRLEEERRQTFDIETIQCPDELSFGQQEHRMWWRPLKGFSIPEEAGVWTEAESASFEFFSPAARAFKISLFARPFIVLQKSEAIAFKLLVNGQVVGDYNFTSSDYFELQLDFTSPNANQLSLLTLTFNFAPLLSPHALGLNLDARKLGLFLRSLKVIPLAT
jgi:hypothetical protein